MADNNNNKEHNYGAEDITVLEGLDAVRKRPGMYIGSTGEIGLHHLVYEVVDNSVDEALAGYCDKIDITILKDGAVRVIDNGRGIPVEKHKKEKKSTLEVVLTILHAGGKFGDGGYKISGGLHGVGISVVNALSTRVEAVIKRDGYTWTMNFVNGAKDGDLIKGEPTKETGSQITFWPDDKIFETIKFDFITLKTRLQQMAFINKGLKINLSDERVESESQENKVSFLYNNGLIDYVEHLNKVKKVDSVNEKVIYFENADSSSGMELQIGLQWTMGYTESVYSFANTINTTEGGQHEEGFRTALTSIINKFAKSTGVLKEKDENLSGNDVREGLTAVLSLKLLEPQFEGQTKTKLGNTEARTFVQKVINAQLSSFFDANPSIAKDICKKALQAASARIAARKAREATRRKGLMDGFGMPGKLRDCSSRNAELCEIFIVEGDSAGGSAVRGRNPEYQAIMPLRGKPLNVEKVRLDKALSNKEIQSMITAFGTSIGDEFNIDKLRYHKLVLMADADVDGAHIQTLLLTFLFRYVPQLIEEGYVYLAQPPLYRLKWSNSAHQFAFSDEQRDELLKSGRKDGKRIPGDNAIQRYKGLGEMNYEELWDTTMDPAKRSLLQVTMESAAEADEIFSILMGDDVASRREFIQSNAKNVRFLDI